MDQDQDYASSLNKNKEVSIQCKGYNIRTIIRTVSRVCIASFNYY